MRAIHKLQLNDFLMFLWLILYWNIKESDKLTPFADQVISALVIDLAINLSTLMCLGPPNPNVSQS